MRITAGKLVKWILPHGLVALPGVLRLRSARAAEQDLLAKFDVNAALRGRHEGRRCFILCTGPSIKTQNLRRLAGELVIGVSNSYLHPDYNVFRPAYHCIPQITFGKLTKDDAARWLRDMDEHIGQAEMVLSDRERALIAAHSLMASRPVHYLYMEGDTPDPQSTWLPDLTGCVPGPQSVPVMALMLALYMGCKEIYLLGADHDFFMTGRYTYFFEKSPVSGKDHSVDADGNVTSSRYEEFQVLSTLWRQYRWLKTCAAHVGVTIYNATAGGALDEFARVDFATLDLAGNKQSAAASEAIGS